MIYLILGIIILYSLYFYGTKTFNYWKLKGVKHDWPIPFLGNNYKQFTLQISTGNLVTEIYRKYPKEKVVGFYRGLRPEIIIRDPAIVKRILTTDFYHFHERGFNPHRTVVEPLMKNLFMVDGDLWRQLRQRFTPAFSSAKLKAMFYIITNRAEKLQVLAEQVSKYDFYDARELMARYMTELVGASGFGIDMDCLSSEMSQFRKLGKRVFDRKPRDAVVFLLKWIFPEVFKNFHVFAPEITNTTLYLVDKVMKTRNYQPSGNNDFIDLLLETKMKNNKMVGESMVEKNADGSPKIIEFELDNTVLAAQVFVFFGAGFETSSGTSSYTLHQLAFHPEYQEKAQKEIDRVLAKYDNKMTYDAIKDLTYLEMVFLEAMRMYPSVAYLERRCCSQKYHIEEANVTIDEGVRVIIPVKALQNDEKYFKNPDVFDPERFHPDRRNEIEKFVYLPFGEGPRACVGARLGQMQALAAIVAILQKFSVEPAACTVRNPQHNPALLVVEGFIDGLPLKFRKRT